MASVRRLPGLRFEAVAPPLAESLPRMDIPVFAGFTPSGPVNTPLAVEDIARFHDIFGEDIVLARREGLDEPLRGHLAPAVRAFFRNGGKRCWVIRLAAKAVSNVFPVPNLLLLKSNGTLEPAMAFARSEGSWSDGHRVATALAAEIVTVVRVTIDPTEILLPASSASNLSAGDLLRVQWNAGGSGYLWVAVAGVSPVSMLSPLSEPVVSVLCGRTHLELDSPPTVPASGQPVAAPLVEKVTFELWVRDASNALTRVTGLGFAKQHPRMWAALPTDLRLADDDTPADEQPDAAQQGLIDEAASPRFPLAGPGVSDSLYLPIGMGVLPGDPVQAAAQAGSAIQRDGLGALTADLFLETALRDTPVLDLAGKADYLRYQAPTVGNKPRQLTGIHAAFHLSEVTILAAPDAVQRGWDEVSIPPIDTPPTSTPPQRPEWWHFLDCGTAQDVPRVSAPPGYGFLPCDLPVIAAPSLSGTSPTAEGTFQLTWTTIPNAIDVLEEASRADFAGAEEISRGTAGSYTFLGKLTGDYYYRVYRIVGAARSDYSNTVAIRIRQGADAVEKPAALYDDRVLLDVQRAMLRMCAARGDLFALLALPRHYREEQSLAHMALLQSTAGRAGAVPPLSAGEAGAFSYGAIYHPWLTGREDNALSELRTSPPEGAMAGVLAQRALSRGAWIAPANEKLRGVVALDPPISRVWLQAFLEAQLNLIRQEPEGFLCLSSDTLSGDSDTRPVNVRRLLSLVRRLALRSGANYVFEPHSEEFRRLVRRGFESVLEGLFHRGAFAGRTADKAFQVVTDESLNPPQSVREGRFVTEIRIAPSVPLSFLTVRLLQTADRTFVTEGK